MKKFVLSILIIICSCCVSFMQANAEEPIWLSEYFPLMYVDATHYNEWIYTEVVGEGETPQTIMINVSNKEMNRGTQTKRITGFLGDENASAFFGQDHEGTRIFKITMNNYTGTPDHPIVLVPANAFDETTYTDSATISVSGTGFIPYQIDGAVSVQLCGFEDITLNAFINGEQHSETLSCLKVIYTITYESGEPETETWWYAKDIGIVQIQKTDDQDNLQTFQLTNATLYNDSELAGSWTERVRDNAESPNVIGDITLNLTQNGNSLGGNIVLTMGEDTTYTLTIQEGSYVCGPTAVIHGTDETSGDAYDFALTHNSDHLTGAYKKTDGETEELIEYGTIAPTASSGGDGGGSGCFIVTAGKNSSVFGLLLFLGLITPVIILSPRKSPIRK